jgi:aminoglycoside phosphotransferase (APT) family kinase protein
VHPSFVGQRTYLPLDVRGPLGWYLRNQRVAASLRLLARVDPRTFGRFAPRLALVAANGPGGALAFSDDALPRVLKGRELRPLLLVHGTESTSAVMLPFSAGSTEPLAVMKVRRDVGAEARTDAGDTLVEVRRSVDDSVRASIPEPLGIARAGDLTAAVESFLPGQWLHARLSRRRLPADEAVEDLDLAIDWIADLHARFPLGRTSWSEAEIAEHVERPVQAFEHTLGSNDGEAALFAELRRRANDLRGRELPVVWRHGDFSSLNVLRNGPSINVVDWEMAGRGLPLEDPLHFVRSWLYLVRKADRPETFTAFSDLFLRPDHHGRFVDAGRAAIARYLRRLGLDPGFVPLLLVAALVGRATERAQGRAVLRGQPSDPRERNRYVTYLALAAERPNELFESTAIWAGS